MIRFAVLMPLLLLVGCRPPAGNERPEQFAPPAVAATPSPVESPIPSDIPSTAAPSCEDDLRFLGDVTIPDSTIVIPGDKLDKRWQVLNSGTCNWDERYTLVLVTGPEMGAVSPRPLYPAISGSETALRIIFTAPDNSGIYRSAWQAADPAGRPFGDWIFIEIIVP